jgi:hypothetical protein
MELFVSFMLVAFLADERIRTTGYVRRMLSCAAMQSMNFCRCAKKWMKERERGRERPGEMAARRWQRQRELHVASGERESHSSDILLFWLRLSCCLDGPWASGTTRLAHVQRRNRKSRTPTPPFQLYSAAIYGNLISHPLCLYLSAVPVLLLPFLVRYLYFSPWPFQLFAPSLKTTVSRPVH